MSKDILTINIIYIASFTTIIYQNIIISIIFLL